MQNREALLDNFMNLYYHITSFNNGLLSRLRGFVIYLFQGCLVLIVKASDVALLQEQQLLVVLPL